VGARRQCGECRRPTSCHHSASAQRRAVRSVGYANRDF
jgi:hypothetical protein